MGFYKLISSHKELSDTKFTEYLLKNLCDLLHCLFNCTFQRKGKSGTAMVQIPSCHIAMVYL